jgi:putative ABC transport system permease protein
LAQTTVFEDLLGRLGTPANTLTTIGLLAVCVVIARLALGWFLQTDIGLAVRATGNNERMIRGLGVDTDSTKILALALSNALVGLTGALVAQDQGFADATMGLGVLVIAVAGIIIGQVLLPRASSIQWLLWAVVIGTIIYRALLATALRLGMPPTALKLVTAALVLVALGLPSYLARRRAA